MISTRSMRRARVPSVLLAYATLITRRSAGIDAMRLNELTGLESQELEDKSILFVKAAWK
jgi:hypothetical protein